MTHATHCAISYISFYFFLCCDQNPDRCDSRGCGCERIQSVVARRLHGTKVKQTVTLHPLHLQSACRNKTGSGQDPGSCAHFLQ